MTPPVTEPSSGPVRYELIAKDSRSIATNANAEYLGDLAGRLWPDQEQDEDRTGKGWDVQVVGAE